ncbi:MAG: PEGA domain-containing protein [Acidobacteriota bacterium]
MVESSPVFADGFGRRVVRVTTTEAPPTEHLVLDSVLAGNAAFAAALKERAAHLHGRRLTSYARVQRVEADGAGGLAIVSDYIKGWRLADLLDVAESENLTFDIGVVMLLLRQLLPTAALLSTQSRDTASGALGPEHLLLTPQARLVLTDYVLGSAIDSLGWPAERLWRTLRVAMPAGVDGATVSQRSDVVQVGLTVLSLIVGRRLRDDEFPDRLEDLVTSARQKTPAVIHAPLSGPLRDWLLRALQLAPKNFATLFDAQMALERLLAAEPSLLAQPSELDTAVARFERFMPGFELPVPEVELLLEAPPPGQVPLAAAFDRLPAPKADAAAAAASLGVDLDVPAPPSRRSGVRKRAAASAADLATMPEAAVSGSIPAPFLAAVADVVLPAPWASPIVAASSAVAPAPGPMAASTAPAPALPVVATAPGPDTGTATATVTPIADWHAPALAADDTPSHDPVSAPAGTAWWQSLRAVAALAAVAMAQTLFIGWLLSRPTEGLGGDGELVVQSRPGGAKVFIDGTDRGVTPLTARVKPGTHVLQVRAGTAEPRVIPLQIRAGVQTAQYVELIGVASTGVLEVRSEPSKAKVTIDGRARGSTPLTLRDVPPGDYQVVLERAGWKSTQTVRIEPGSTAQLVVPIR